MESPQLGSSSAEDRSVKTAEALRALKEKLGPRVDSDRRTATDVQSDIIGRIFQIAEEMACEKSTEAQAAARYTGEKLTQLQDSLLEREQFVSQLQSELEELKQDRTRLQDELREERATAAELRSAECGDCSELREKLRLSENRAMAAEASAEELKADAEAASKEIAELRSWQESSASQDEQAARLREELAQAEGRCADFGNEVAGLTAERDTLAEELATVRSKLEQQIFDSVTSDSSLQAELDEAKTTVTRLQEELSGLEARSQEGASEEHEQLLEAQRELAGLRQEHESLTDELSKAQATSSQLHDEKESLHESLTNELAEAKQLAEQTQAEFEALSVERDELSTKLEALNEELATKHAESSDDAAQREEELRSAKEQVSHLADEKQQLEELREQLSRQLEEAVAEREQSTSQLQEAQQQLGTLPDYDAQTEELEKAQRKFELAQADAQKLKRELATLQEELARRPEANEQESPELVSLRVERDDLAARVAELEEIPVQAVDEDSQQQLADLQRRFEMAVEDLRKVKQEKVELEEKLANSSHGITPVVDTGAMDWQSQKARLLASLESDGDDEETSPERAEEKMSIQGTIDITDQIVAKKDREIAELQQQLATKAEAKSEPKNLSAEICDQDEVIQAERVRLEQLQAEWRDKVRSAELEMSTQRATLARKESELKELLAAAKEAAADVTLGNDGKPRRRWLSALGLGEDDSKEQ